MTDETEKKERIAKRMARAGLCSRRDAERWIAAGRVVVNGTKLESPAFTVSPTDTIIVDGNPLPKKERPRLWRYHKPVGLVTSHKDEKGRDTVFDKLPEDMPRVISVGRLDLNSEGLLLLTNDGELARRLELPATGWKRKYRVRVHGHPKERDLQLLRKGVTVEGVKYGAIEADLDSTKGANSWLTISLREGKNREIRKVMEFLGYTVLRLIRVSYGPLQLGELEDGKVEEVKSKILRDQMGVEKFEEEDDDIPEVNDKNRRGRPTLRTKGGPKPTEKRGGRSSQPHKPGGMPGKRPAPSRNRSGKKS
ncbi:pseudouridine synthase [Sneathiella sp.]|jgi:23S rRNA pseudouridine2605 synthase|uniref:pseudouridine synthase n=1 Tax=Sneathiella sp. TaxID=1964365 RepID=UPI0039E692FA